MASFEYSYVASAPELRGPCIGLQRSLFPSREVKTRKFVPAANCLSLKKIERRKLNKFKFNSYMEVWHNIIEARIIQFIPNDWLSII